MKQVSILVAGGMIKPSSLFNIIEIFEKANEFYTKLGQEPFYRVQMVGLDVNQSVLNGFFAINAIEDISTVGKTDLVVIPGYYPNDDYAIAGSAETISWLIG